MVSSVSGELKYAKGPFNKFGQPRAVSSTGEVYLGGTFENDTLYKQRIVKLNIEGEVEWEKVIDESSSCFSFRDIKVSSEGDRVAILGGVTHNCKKSLNGERQYNTNSRAGTNVNIRILSKNGDDLISQFDPFWGGSPRKIFFFRENKIVFRGEYDVTILTIKDDRKVVEDFYWFEIPKKGNIAVNDDAQLAAFVSTETKELKLVQLFPETTNVERNERGTYKTLATLSLGEDLANSITISIQFRENNTIEVTGQFVKGLFKYKN